uniref:Uncharacterized protein n=1 Tax=Arundo donax TaxID=35708 RepID=A0A0A8YJM9_ARUDO
MWHVGVLPVLDTSRQHCSGRSVDDGEILSITSSSKIDWADLCSTD